MGNVYAGNRPRILLQNTARSIKSSVLKGNSLLSGRLCQKSVTLTEIADGNGKMPNASAHTSMNLLKKNRYAMAKKKETETKEKEMRKVEKKKVEQKLCCKMTGTKVTFVTSMATAKNGQQTQAFKACD